MTEREGTGPRGRTRRAILDAAAAELSRDPGTALGRIAQRAGVGRTTLHRHFPDRAALVAALAADALAATEAAIAEARLDEGDARQALARLVREMTALGDRFAFLLREPALTGDADVAAGEERAIAPVRALIARGQAEGAFRDDLPAGWIAEAAGMLVYAAWITTGGGLLARSDAGDVVVTTLLSGVGATSAGPAAARPPDRPSAGRA